MKFNRRSRLDTSRIRDRRGGGGGGIALGGGLGGIAVLVIAVLLGVDPTALLEQGGGPQAGPGGGELEHCDSGDDVSTNAECRFVVVENSVQNYWAGEFEQRGSEYQPATFTTFTGAIQTRCGNASSAVGPFYCPGDNGVYLDLGFFDVLRQRLGAEGGDFAEAYVVAHEFGHHVQNITGQMDRVQTREGPESDAVRLELQADCYAGVWAHHATTTSAEGSDQPLITEISQDDIAEAVDAAETVGDDYIQERMQGTVTPESWTHGSSEQRREWFQQGLDTGDPGQCDTFRAERL